MMIRWEDVELYLNDQIDTQVARLKSNLDMQQTAMVRGHIAALEGLLQLPALLTVEADMSDGEDLPHETEINHGR